MLSFLKCLLACAVAAAFAVAGQAANTQVSADKPVINFRLPTFTPEGFRSWLVRGSEASFSPKDNLIDVKELTLSVFSGKSDGRLVSMILSPSAKVRPGESVVTGDSTIRVINDEFEATGTQWLYAHKERKISIQKKVRVTLHSEFKDILK